MEELKKCPFCGGDAAISYDPDGVEDTMGHKWRWNVVCNRCAASTGLCHSEQKAKEAWNRRAQ